MKSILITISMVGLLSLQGFTQSKKQLNQTDESVKIVKLKVTGLSCAGCASHLYKVLKNENGIIESYVEYPGDIAIVHYDSRQTKPMQIMEAIKGKTNYGIEILKKKTNENGS